MRWRRPITHRSTEFFRKKTSQVKVKYLVMAHPLLVQMTKQAPQPQELVLLRPLLQQPLEIHQPPPMVPQLLLLHKEAQSTTLTQLMRVKKELKALQHRKVINLLLSHLKPQLLILLTPLQPPIKPRHLQTILMRVRFHKRFQMKNQKLKMFQMKCWLNTRRQPRRECILLNLLW
jgi:hypothetical protein